MKYVFILTSSAVALLTALLSIQSDVFPDEKTGAEYYEAGFLLFQQSCLSEDFEPGLCNKAVEELVKAIKLNPKHAMARRDLAQVLMSQGKVDEAFKEYMRYLQLGSYRSRQDGFDHMLFAKSLAQAGRLKEAVEIYEKVLALAHDESRFE